jgi:hypothetical protein
LEQEERDSITELQAVRTRGRQLKNNLKKLELKLALKDQLQLETGNLHLVDYDQLKMENESLNQKASLKLLFNIWLLYECHWLWYPISRFVVF